jgi:hypothetical protein
MGKQSYKTLTVKYKEGEEFEVYIELLREYAKEMNIPLKTALLWAIKDFIEKEVGDEKRS